MTDAPAFKVHPRDTDTRIDHLLKHRWGLQLTCRGCQEQVKWYADKLETLPGALTMSALAARAKCGACHGRDGIIQVINDPGSVMRDNLARLAGETN